MKNGLMLALLGVLTLTGCGGGKSTTTNPTTGRLLVVRDEGRNKDIYTLGEDGTVVQRLTTDPAVDNEPRWSPDQSKIAFVRELAGGESIFVMNADGSGAVELTPGLVAYDPRWLPNGKLAYAMGVGAASEIWVMNADGSGKTRLTSDTIGDICPEISPNGATIAYMKNIGGTHYIYLMNPDGTNQRGLSDPGGGVVVGSLAFSKDSSQLAFVSSPSGTKEVFLVNSDGTNQRRLTNNSADDFAINWSPDGSKLLFASMRDGNNELYTMNPDGTGQTRITTNSVSDIPFGWR